MARQQTTWAHVVARAQVCPVPLTHEASAHWLWQRLRGAFPDALAAVLMPTRLHVITPCSNEVIARRKLADVVSGVVRSGQRAAANRWHPVEAHALPPDRWSLARCTRSLALHPVRAGLVPCPLGWLWSTHRDVMGATVDAWVTAERMAEALGRTAPDFRVHLHRYVSSDAIRIRGTPLPQPYAGDARGLAMDDAVRAALVSTRAPLSALGKPSHARQALFALVRAGNMPTRQLSELCELTPGAIRYHLRKAESIPSATLLCLGDARLAAPPEWCAS